MPGPLLGLMPGLMLGPLLGPLLGSLLGPLLGPMPGKTAFAGPSHPPRSQPRDISLAGLDARASRSFPTMAWAWPHGDGPHVVMAGWIKKAATAPISASAAILCPLKRVSMCRLK